MTSRGMIRTRGKRSSTPIRRPGRVCHDEAAGQSRNCQGAASAGQERGSSVQAPLGLVTARHLARELGCSMRTVRRRIAAGDLPRPFKIGGIAYWRQRVLDAWLGKRERAGADSQGRVL